ncbi:MAG: DUF459 domain-containing protein [Syntrophobacteraceae bacterium]|nr:DUF459 domain-containing protein [Syntrophobacteraceae bacterium]
MMKTSQKSTSLRAVLVYTVAMAVVIFFEFSRVSSWAQDSWWSLTSYMTANKFARNVREKICDPIARGRKSQTVPSPKIGVAAGLTAQIRKIPSDCPAATTTATSHPIRLASTEGPLPAQVPAPPPYGVRLKPRKVLIVGDSEMAEGFGPALQRRLEKYTTVKVLRKGVYSTGFVHQETFNWTDTLKSLIATYHPDLIVIHMGANDPIDIVPKTGRRMYFGNDKWREVYGLRVAQFLKIVSEKKIMTFWVGMPIMGSAKYCAKIEVINSVFKQECDKVSGCFYVDTWSALTSTNGKYTAYERAPSGKLCRIRAKDNVHLTGAGGKLLTDFFLKVASQHVQFPVADKVSSSK